MIAYVSGTLAEKSTESVVVDVQGLGYRLLIPTSTYQALPAKGEDVKLYTYQHVREDALTLYGFARETERAVFEVMLGVSGVGPKLALAALSAMTPSELRDHVLEGDVSRLTDISGVGKKTAERLILDLRDRLADLDIFEGAGAAPISGGSKARAAARTDALAALESLGLGRAAAERAIRKVLRDNAGIQSADKLVRLALREE